MLFVILIDVLLRLPLKSEIICCADDTKLIFAGSANSEVRQNLEEHLEVVRRWLDEHELRLNSTKSSCMYILKSSKIKDQPFAHISCGGDTLKSVKSVRDLGLLVDRHLTFAAQVEQTHRKMSHHFFILRSHAQGMSQLYDFNCSWHLYNHIFVYQFGIHVTQH